MHDIRACVCVCVCVCVCAHRCVCVWLGVALNTLAFLSAAKVFKPKSTAQRGISTGKEQMVWNSIDTLPVFSSTFPYLSHLHEHKTLTHKRLLMLFCFLERKYVFQNPVSPVRGSCRPESPNKNASFFGGGGGVLPKLHSSFRSSVTGPRSSKTVHVQL